MKPISPTPDDNHKIPQDSTLNNPIININNINKSNLPIKPPSKKKGKPGKSKEQYLTDSQKLIIHSKRLAGTSVKDLCNEFNITTQTVHNVVSQFQGKILNSKELDQVQKSLISLSYANAFQASNSVTQEKMDSSSLVQLGVFSKISIEIARLLQEKSTANIAIHSLNQTINDEIANLREKMSNLDNNIPKSDHSPSKQTPIDTIDNNNETKENEPSI